MKRSEAFPSKFMSKDDVQVPIVATIGGVKPEILKSDNGEEQKPVMYFTSDHKPLILNNTNWMTMEDWWGDDSDKWLGKKIELYFEPNIMFGNKRVGGVRVRTPNVSGVAQPEANPLSTWTDAVKECQLHGVTADDLKDEFKRLGKATYKPVTDAEIVRKFIADTIAAREETIS